MFFRLSFLFLFLSFSSFSQRQVALTFDDLPAVSARYTTPAGKDTLTRLLLGHLTRHKAPAIGFVIGDARQPALRLWTQAGMTLGNHTFAHSDFHRVPSAEHLQDILLCHRSMTNAGFRPAFFRSPYLHRGHSRTRQDSLTSFLRELGYREAPVTVDNADYLFSSAYDKALLRHDTAAANAIGRQFVDYLRQCLRYYEAQALSLVGRAIPQTVLLHANTLNAHWLGVLLDDLHREGVTFITLEEALKDPVYASPDTYTGKGGISWIHRWALTQGKKGAFFDGEPEVPAHIR